jgi:hypothetical protein
LHWHGFLSKILISHTTCYTLFLSKKLFLIFIRKPEISSTCSICLKWLWNWRLCAFCWDLYYSFGKTIKSRRIQQSKLKRPRSPSGNGWGNFTRSEKRLLIIRNLHNQKTIVNKQEVLLVKRKFPSKEERFPDQQEFSFWQVKFPVYWQLSSDFADSWLSASVFLSMYKFFTHKK